MAVALALAALPGEEGAVDPGVAKVAALAGEAGVARGTAAGFDGPGLLRAVRTLVAQLQGGSPEPEKSRKMFTIYQGCHVLRTYVPSNWSVWYFALTSILSTLLKTLIKSCL